MKREREQNTFYIYENGNTLTHTLSVDLIHAGAAHIVNFFPVHTHNISLKPTPRLCSTVCVCVLARCFDVCGPESMCMIVHMYVYVFVIFMQVF